MPIALPPGMVEIETTKVATVSGVGIEYVVLVAPTDPIYLVRAEPGEPDQEPCIVYQSDSMMDALAWVGATVDEEVARETGR